jgi:hypothetical protein
MTDENETETAAPPPLPDPTLLQRVYDRVTVEGEGAVKSGGPIVPLKRVTFDVDGAECAPGMFVDAHGNYITFRLTLSALTSAQELKCTKGITDPAAAAMSAAQASIAELNGAPVLGAQLDFLWEALGPGGRQLVLVMFQEVGSATPASMGKAQASITVG